eukprot:NODE_391_length_9459_cov_0.222970.p4 type:complete len:230 gc:universal NODE_391_length_9459_cov_0.222970:482-1171(+)
MGTSSGSSDGNNKWEYFENSPLRAAIPPIEILTPNDQVSVPNLVQNICAHRNWEYEPFKKDVDYLDGQYIRILADLHVLRKNSFDKLEIKVILRDILFKISQMSLKYLVKKVKSVDNNNETSLITSIVEKELTPAEIAKSLLTGKKANASVQVTNIQVAPSNSDRLIVNANGINYECQRYCPHKNVDMLHGYVEGNNLICQKHGWAFNLSNGGLCKEKGKTVHACQLQW